MELMVLRLLLPPNPLQGTICSDLLHSLFDNVLNLRPD